MRLSRFQNKRTVCLLGAFIAALFLLFRWFLYMNLVLPPELIEDGVAAQWMFYNLAYCGVVVAAILVGIIGFRRSKRWGLMLMQAGVLMAALDFCKMFAMCSFWSWMGVISFAGWTLSCVLIIISVTKRLRRVSGVRPSWIDRFPRVKVFLRRSGCVVMGLVIGFFAVYLAHYFYIYPKGRIVYSAAVEDDGWQSYDVLGCSFLAPEGLEVREDAFGMDQTAGPRMAFLGDEEGGMTIGVNILPVEYGAQLFHYRNAYEFNRRVMRLMRFWEQLFILRKFKAEIVEVGNSAGLDGFRMKMALRSGGDLYLIFLSDQNDRDRSTSIGLMFEETSPLNDTTAAHIIGSLKLE